MYSEYKFELLFFFYEIPLQNTPVSSKIESKNIFSTENLKENWFRAFLVLCNRFMKKLLGSPKFSCEISRSTEIKGLWLVVTRVDASEIEKIKFKK